MLDIGFSEIALIFTLALVVLGPEKLPRVASQVGRWIGRARGMARQFREQLEEEVNLEEARKARPPEQTDRARPPIDTFVPPAAVLPAPPPPDGQVHVPDDYVAPPAVASRLQTAVDSHSPPPAVARPAEHPDWYSHAHPSDSEGRPLPPPDHQNQAAEVGQQDWVGAQPHSDPAPTDPAPPTDKPAALTAAYAPPHERGI